MKLRYLSLVAALLSGASVAAKKPFTADDLVTLKRVGATALSPDGNKLVYSLRETDLEANRGRTDLWLLDVKSQKSQRLTTDPASDGSPRWSNDGQSIYFLSGRSGSSQIWRYDINKKKPTQITDFEVDVTTFKLSSDNNAVVFSADVFPDCKDFACTAARHKLNKEKKTSGVVYQHNFVRHWDQWEDDTLSRLFYLPLEKNAKPILVSGSVFGDIPSKPFGGDEEYTISHDGKKVWFSARLKDAVEPTSTNFDIYQVSVDSPANAHNLTEANKAWDTQPVISHDGKTMAWLAHRRPGFESDRFEVIVKDLATGKQKHLTENWDRSFGSIAFSQDDQYLYLSGNHLGTKVAWRVNVKSGKYQQLTKGGYLSGLAAGTHKIIFKKDDLKHPADIWIADLDGRHAKQLTHVNQQKLKTIAFGNFEQFKFKGWNDETVYGYVVKPANFKKGKKYPLAFLIHGGPQGSFGDHFHYRWNPQTYTGQGFVAVMIDFHGSTGYGQAFTDSISGDWGGKPLEDLKKGFAYAAKTYPFIDANNSCALGASYGGYMINWIAGNWSDQFKCLVNHDGVFDNRMMYYATEELWFTEWENGGPYYKVPDNHEKYNPVNYVKNWKTPMMVVQGELDYRIPVTQGLGTFTALQRKGIDSKLLYFPDENHWVLKPANSILWHNEVNSWLHKYLDK